MSAAIVNSMENRGPMILQSLEGRLRVAASKGQKDELVQFIKDGATFEPDRDGRTALHYSAQNGYMESCKILMHHGCNTDCTDALGYTPLHRCIAQGYKEIGELLLNEGCMIDVQDQHGNTPVHEAAWNGYSKSLELLVKHNCNVHLANKAGFTALHLASQAGHNESSRVLLYAGCNPDTKNNYGDTALHTASRYGHAGVTRILISARCRLHEQNKNGDTSLHITAALRRRKIAKLLVESHIDVSLKNKQNETAMDVARRKEHPEIILIITSFSRPRPPRHGSRERELPSPQVAFKDEIDIIDGPVIVPDDQLALKPDKNEEKKRFFFFKKKKKDKDKEKSKVLPVVQEKPGAIDPRMKVDGFFSQYVPKQGVQYYRDLAGNIKQGPVGYSPACQCGPTFKKMEQNMDKTTGNLYEHMDASHRILSDRIDHLDQRTSQQVYAIDKLTRERLEQERQACQNRITERIEEEWSGNRNVLSQYNQQIETWLDDKMASYGHCLNHHHDDSALPSRNILFDFHHGHLFKSRSDETLSDCSGKNRKKDFYESRQAAMRQIRGWSVPAQGDSTHQKERNNNHITVIQAQVHPSKNNNNNMDRKVESAKYEENANTTYHNFNNPGTVRRDKKEGAIPKQTANYQQWQRPSDVSGRPASGARQPQFSPFDSQLYRSMLRNEADSNRQHSNLGRGGIQNQNNSTGARDSSLGKTLKGTGPYSTKILDQNRNYQPSAYNSRPLTPNYRLAKSSDLLHEDLDIYAGITRTKSVEQKLDNCADLNRSPHRKSVTFLDGVANKTPTPMDSNDYRNGVTVSSNSGQYRKPDTFKSENPYTSASELRKQSNNLDSCNRVPPLDQHRAQNQICNSVKTTLKPCYQPETMTCNRQYPANGYHTQTEDKMDKSVTVNGTKSPGHVTPSNFLPFDHSSPGQVVCNTNFVNKEDSTCSSNPDSGYSSKGLGQGTQSISCTPSSSFSADRSLSIGTPSNSNSPCLTNPMNYQVPKPLSANSNQQNGWYQRKLLEAAEKMRNTRQYSDHTETTQSTYNDLYVTLNYDPVHGSDV